MVYNMFGPGNPESAAAAMPTPAAPTPVNDFVVYRPSASDEMVGIKEGGILAKKLDRIADLLTQMTKTGGSTVIEMDGKRVGQAVVKAINNDLYSLT